jgi:hypothetical protein
MCGEKSVIQPESYLLLNFLLTYVFNKTHTSTPFFVSNGICCKLGQNPIKPTPTGGQKPSKASVTPQDVSVCQKKASCSKTLSSIRVFGAR